MELLTLDEKYLEQKGALLTAAEIAGQPKLWKHIAQDFHKSKERIHSFLEKAYTEVDNIILTGAGSSAFIGLSLSGSFFRQTGIITQAIATTDIVSNPRDYFNDRQTTLVISFARSGSSPESCAALELADKFAKKCFHFIITCDENGELAKFDSSNPVFMFVLPEAANDKSLAMTGSYSGMLLTGLLIAYINNKEVYDVQVDLVTRAADAILSQAAILKTISSKSFNRAVFLGSGALFGTATESALKLQELTDGKVICKSETYLGLRHGPKAVIDDETLVVYFFSSDNYVNKYEQDLVNTMNDGSNALFCLAVGESHKPVKNTDAQVSYGLHAEKIVEDFLPVCSILVGQLLGFYKSLQSGLMPDNPSINGAISRVVQGVTIYPVEKEMKMNYD